jgi:hypothetical protein
MFGFNSVLHIYTSLTWSLYVSEDLTDQINKEIPTRTEFPMVETSIMSKDFWRS